MSEQLPEKFLVTREMAASLLSMSLRSFERYVQPELRLVRRGRMVLVVPRELEEWSERNSRACSEDA